MVDIAASLSLTPNSLPLDPAAALGAETADIQAFGDILAGQIAGPPTSDPAASPIDLQLPKLPLPAGNRQPGGKILPGAVPDLPEAAAAPVAVIASGKPVLTTLAARLAAPSQVDTEAVPTQAKPGESPVANPVHALLKMVTTGARAARQSADEAPSTRIAQDAAPEADDTEEASLAVTLATGVPVLAMTVVPMSPLALPDGETASSPAQAAPAQTFAAPEAAPRKKHQPNESAANPSVAPQVVAGAKAETPIVPVLTVAAVPAEAAKAAAPAVTLASAQILPAGAVTTARIKVATREPSEGQTLAADRIAASLTPAADRAPIVDRVMPAATPTVTDGQPSLTAAPAVPVTTAPTVEMPRHDFAALVERLVEARNAAAPASTHASINHAEFGQVSLHFQQDGNDLKVGMSSADPGFAAAVQAAMPTERQNTNADTQQRGQGNQPSGQSQNQSASTSSNSNHETAGQRGTETGEQGNRQGRNSRGGNNNSNPSQRWTGEQPQSRGGIFA
jgi:hypothetical protein